MWPTCIGFATFGELKSMTIVSACWTVSTPSLWSRAIAAVALARKPAVSRKLMKPAPSISGRLGNIADIQITDDLAGDFSWRKRDSSWRAPWPYWSGSRQSGDRWPARPPAAVSGKLFSSANFSRCVRSLARCRHQLRGERLSKTRRIWAASCALLSSSRTDLSLRNLAIAASVRR